MWSAARAQRRIFPSTYTTGMTQRSRLFFIRLKNSTVLDAETGKLFFQHAPYCRVKEKHRMNIQMLPRFPG